MQEDNIPRGETLSREHLANERTLLTWVRTGVNMIGAGILLHFAASFLSTVSKGTSTAASFTLFGFGIVVLGALVEIAAVVRFIRYRTTITQGSLTSSALIYILIILGLILLGVASVGYVVIGKF